VDNYRWIIRDRNGNLNSVEKASGRIGMMPELSGRNRNQAVRAVPECEFIGRKFAFLSGLTGI